MIKYKLKSVLTCSAVTSKKLILARQNISNLIWRLLNNIGITYLNLENIKLL